MLLKVEIDVVTGAFGYIGRYIARRLLSQGRQVKTITTHPGKKSPFDTAVEAYPYDFNKPTLLIDRLRGAHTLYNTYWVRFEHDGATFQKAIENSEILFRCAMEAGIKKVVHISVTKPSLNSSLPYFKGKAEVEQALITSGLHYAIVRPTVVFGKEDILINNIAWMMRKIPWFPIFGSGQYRIQPVHAEDVASIAVSCAVEEHSRVVDAVGPETFSFEELLRLLASKVKPTVKLVRINPVQGIFFGQLIGMVFRDVVLTNDELKGLMDGLLFSDQPPNGKILFSKWLEENKETIGRSYSSELARHFRN